MSNTGGKRAWEFLKRNPGYKEAAAEAAAGAACAPAEPAPFPMRVQTDADLDAAAWGLLAWEDPLADGVPAPGTSVSPIWAEAPVLKAVPSPSPPVAALAAESGWRLSGLRLADGTVMLKVEHGVAAVQLRVSDGAGFDPAGGIRLWVDTPADMRVPLRLRRAADLWPAVGIDSKKAADASLTGNCCRCWTRNWPARACGRLRSNSTTKNTWRRNGRWTARCGRRCAGGWISRSRSCTSGTWSWQRAGARRRAHPAGPPPPRRQGG